LKQERIKKLREEFNYIKNQFTAACAAIPNSSMGKRVDLKSRGNSSIVNNNRMSINTKKVDDFNADIKDDMKNTQSLHR